MACGGKVYVIGGYCDGGKTQNEVYDPQTNSWDTKKPVPNNNHYAPFYGVLDGKIHIIGGQVNTIRDDGL